MIHRPARTRLALLAVFLLLLSAVSVSAQTSDGALVRLVHAIPGASPVDVYTDGQLTASGLAFGEATEYISFPAGERSLTVTQAGGTTPLWEQVLPASAGGNYTLVASSAAAPAFTVYRDENDLDPLALGVARFTSIHAIADAPAIDILLEDGRAVVVNQGYNQPFGTLDLPLFTYNLVVAPTGAGVEGGLFNLELPISFSGTSYKLILYGTASDPRFMVLTAPVRAEAASGFSRVRLVHAVPGAPTVDVYAGSTLLATLTEPAQGANATGFIAVPAGTYDIAVRAAGATDDLLTGSLTVADGDNVTAAVISTASGLTLATFPSDFGAASASQPLLRVINIGPDAPVSATLDDGSVVAADIAVGAAGPQVAGPSADEWTLSVTAGDAALAPFTGAFYGGVFYDVLAAGGDTAALFPLPPVAVAQGIASAPGALTAVAQAQPPAPPTLPPPAQPVEQAPTATPEPAVVIAPPAVAVTPPPISGRVFNLNPDANLQLRQYPNSDALSLGTIPFNTVLTVNGREGALAEIFISATLVPPDYEYEDPVSLLEDEKDDLDPAQTWLFITYDTPDGGQIDAWVRADFIDVRDASGSRLLLRDLETVPANTPGEARNTDITPPPVRQDVATVRVINLSAGANLNVRRTPTADSEVLARLPLGTVAGLVGINEAGDWAFITYSSGDGSTVTGWANTTFIAYEYNGRTSDLEELNTRGLLQIVPDDTRGTTGFGAAPVVLPTVDPVRDAIVATVRLDPGANLNLRRNPDVNAEVIAPIPSGTQIIVSGRTEDGIWLQATYEGLTGWIAARTDTATFVTLTFNGAPFNIQDVPLAETAGSPAG